MSKLDRQMEYLGAERVKLRSVKLLPELEEHWDAMVEAHSASALQRLRLVDRQRMSWVMSNLRGGSLLDVGAGHGLLVGAAYRRGLGVTGVDITPSRFLTPPAPVAEGDGRVLSGIADHSVDTVTALEVLEHQVDGDLEQMIAELRRVARLRLIVTMPFDQDPLPDYHKQRFNAGRMLRTFPGARYTLLEKPNGTPWIAAIEDYVAEDREIEDVPEAEVVEQGPTVEPEAAATATEDGEG